MKVLKDLNMRLLVFAEDDDCKQRAHDFGSAMLAVRTMHEIFVRGKVIPEPMKSKIAAEFKQAVEILEKEHRSFLDLS
jgi:hypothetical protein